MEFLARHFEDILLDNDYLVYIYNNICNDLFVEFKINTPINK